MVRPGGLGALASRFGLAGVANTLVGFAVIAGLDLGAGVEPRIANAAGYAVGLAVGFVLNRAFVFRSDAPLGDAAPRYLAAAAGAFLLNQAVLTLGLAILGSAPATKVAAQLVAMASYTAAMFVICRLWVFRPGSAHV